MKHLFGYKAWHTSVNLAPKACEFWELENDSSQEAASEQMQRALAYGDLVETYFACKDQNLFLCSTT